MPTPHPSSHDQPLSPKPTTLSYATPDPISHFNPLANAALVFALLPFTLIPLLCVTPSAFDLLLGSFLLSPPIAIVLSALARRAAARNPTRPGRRLALAAWIIAYGQLSLFVLAFLLLPFLGAPRERAQRVKCASHLRQIGQALFIYANDHNGFYPPTLDLLIARTDAPSDIFVCPSGSDDPATGPTTQALLADFAKPGRCSYIYLAAGQTLSSLSADHILAHDRIENHEKEGMNILFGDGCVEWASSDLAQHYLSELSAGHNPPRPPTTQPLPSTL